MTNSTKKIIVIVVAIVIIAVCYWLYKKRKAAAVSTTGGNAVAPVKPVASTTSIVAPTVLPDQKFIGVNIDPWSRGVDAFFYGGDSLYSRNGSASDTQLVNGYGSIPQPTFIVPKQY